MLVSKFLKISIALMALFFIPSLSAQENSLDLSRVIDSENPDKIWISYGPKSAANYSFWFEGQNGIKADWTLPTGYSLGEIKFPSVIESGDRQAPTFLLPAGSRILQEIISPEGTTAELSLVALLLTYGHCADLCISQTISAGLSSDEPTSMNTNSLNLRNRGTWVRAEGTKLAFGLHKNYNKDGRVDRAFFLPADPTIMAEKAPMRLANYEERGFFSTFTLKSPIASDAIIKGILVLDKPLVNGLESHAIARKNDFAMSGEIPMEETTGAIDGTQESGNNVSVMELLTAMGLAFIGGLILNAMPCVFPVLALKVFSVIKSGNADQQAIQKDALAYTAGVVLSFVALAGALIAIRAAGIGAGWGYQLQSPTFVLTMALIFFTLGLNFLGVFEIPGFLAGAGQSLTEKKGAKGAFFTGVLATLVAAPCTAPFMVTAVAFALGQPPVIALSIFAALGLGLASPYLVIGFVPASRGFIPKPGQWMITFRSFLAFPMFATVIWMIWTLSIQAGSTGVFLSLVPMLMIGFGLWASKALNGITKIVAITVSLSVVAYDVTAIKPNIGNMQNNGLTMQANLGGMENLKVIPFSYTKLASLREEGKNVFIHHWAAWCMICLMHENLVFSTEDFQKFLSDTNTVFMQADRTNNDPELVMFMEETYGRSSQPIDVFYTANLMDKPIVFPSVFTTAKVTHLMRQRMKAMTKAD